MVTQNTALAAVGVRHDEATEDKEKLDKQIGVGEKGPLRDAANEMGVVKHHR